MINIRKEISQINSSEMGNMRSYVSNNGLHFPWEDDSFLDLLVNGPSKVYFSYSSSSREQETRYVKSCDCLRNLVLENVDCTTFKQKTSELAETFDGDFLRRFEYYSQECSEILAQRKSLLIVGDGGIGKTKFLFELAEAYSKKHVPYVISFSNSSLRKILDFDLNTLASEFKDGFIFIIDAINERDEDLVNRLVDFTRAVTASKEFSIIVSTKSGSDSSHEQEFEKVMLAKYRFPGVNSASVISELSSFGTSAYFLFQEMLMGGNPRNLIAAKHAIDKLAKNTKSRKAIAQRTTIVENCIKEQIGKERWQQTKDICGYLYKTKKTTFSYSDAQEVLGTDVDAYINDIMITGFLRYYTKQDGSSVYIFSSESQMNVLIARSLFRDKEFSQINVNNDVSVVADEIAAIVAKNIFAGNSHDMCQAAVDRFIDRGSELFVELIRAFGAHDIWFDEVKLIRETLFPKYTDFTSILTGLSLDPGYAFLEFGGYVNNPLNVTNYSNRLLLEKPDAIYKAFMKSWDTYRLSDFIHRLKNISYCISYSTEIEPQAINEWLWLGAWSCVSSHGDVRMWAMRILRALVDASEDAVCLLLKAWNSIDFVRVRRAIAKTLAESKRAVRKNAEVICLARKVINDPVIIDYETNRYFCTLLGTPLINGKARNILDEYRNVMPSIEVVKSVKDLVFAIDAFYHNYFPFDYLKFMSDIFEFSGIDRFLNVDKTLVMDWNRRFADRLSCPKDCPCSGDVVFWNDAASVVPILFEKSDLDSVYLQNAFFGVVEGTYQRAGKPLTGSGKFGSDDWRYRDQQYHPDFELMYIALELFIGSLAINYYTDSIVISSDEALPSGFQYCHDWVSYNRDKEVQFTIPEHSDLVDVARRHILKRLEDPSIQAPEWFHDIDSVKKELFSLLNPIKVNGIEWVAVTVDVRWYYRNNHDLISSNEALLCIASVEAGSLAGYGDRVYTIEHEKLKGHPCEPENNERFKCLEALLPEYAVDDTFEFCMHYPPLEIVDELALTYRQHEGSFYASGDNKPAIVCDANPRDYFGDVVSGLILLRKDLYDYLVERNKIKFFAFTQRYAPSHGYGADCDLHWEFLPDGTIVSMYPNDGSSRSNYSTLSECGGCYFSDEEREERRRNSNVTYVDPDWLREIQENKL